MGDGRVALRLLAFADTTTCRVTELLLLAHARIRQARNVLRGLFPRLLCSAPDVNYSPPDNLWVL